MGAARPCVISYSLHGRRVSLFYPSLALHPRFCCMAFTPYIYIYIYGLFPDLLHVRRLCAEKTPLPAQPPVKELDEDPPSSPSSAGAEYELPVPEAASEDQEGRAEDGAGGEEDEDGGAMEEDTDEEDEDGGDDDDDEEEFTMDDDGEPEEDEV